MRLLEGDVEGEEWGGGGFGEARVGVVGLGGEDGDVGGGDLPVGEEGCDVG